MPERKLRTIIAEDLYNFELITDFRISPDGTRVAYTVQTIDRKTERKHSNLWIAAVSGGKPRQFTHGKQSIARPRWSPDGKFISFISNRDDEKQPQFYLIPTDGGEARVLSNLQGSISDYKWSSDGKFIYFAFTKKDKDAVEREKDEQKKKLGVVARHYTRIFFKFDGAGYLPHERTHLWRIKIANGKAEQLTDGEIHDESDFDLSPDGKTIVFASNRDPNPDLNLYETEFYLMPSSGGKFKKLDAPYGDKRMPKFSPDGKYIAFYHQEGKGEWWRNNRLWVISVDGKSKPRNLTEKYDFHVSNWTINDIIGAMEMMRPLWSNDSSQIYFPVSRHGCTVLKKINADGDKLEAVDVISKNGAVGSYNFDCAQTTLCYYFGDLKDPGQIYALNMKTGEEKTLTKVNVWLKSVNLGEVEEVWFKGASNNDLQGWILKPPTFNPKNKYPAILEIHGGPLVQYGNLFMHEFYYFASQGYVVFFCNPRGGQGYGEKHAAAIHNNWGTVDYDDLMKWTDFIGKKPYIDTNRLGVTGGSYGGYMTNWIIGHTHRFKAAVTQRSVSNLISMWGTSDLNWVFQEVFGNKPPWENLDNLWRQSPMKYIGNAKTPTLVLHNEMDQRCEIEQGEQIYVALKYRGIDTEFVRFPDEPHGLSRGGRTDRRIARLNHILRWMDKYLKK